MKLHEQARSAAIILCVLMLACGSESQATDAKAVAQNGGAPTPAQASAGNTAPKSKKWGPATGEHRPTLEEVHEMFETQPGARAFVFTWATNQQGTINNRWLGVQTIQNPLDAWVTQEIIWDTKPDFIVETGTHKGGSAALWATILAQVNPDGRIITIDIEDKVTKAAELPIVARSVDFIVGSSVDPAVVADVVERTKGKKVLVILDALHTEEHVGKELAAYSPIVNIGSYIIVQDTEVPMTPPALRYGGVARAAAAFVASNDHFEVDKSRERLVLTNNGGGFLKRVR